LRRAGWRQRLLLEVVKMLPGYVIEAVKIPLWDRWQASPATSARCGRGKIFRLSFNADHQGGEEIDEHSKKRSRPEEWSPDPCSFQRHGRRSLAPDA
jgi:hypothetical protein